MANPIAPWAQLDYGQIFFGTGVNTDGTSKPQPVKGALYFDWSAPDKAWIGNGTDWIQIPAVALLVIEAQLQTLYLNALQSGSRITEDPGILRSSMVQI